MPHAPNRISFDDSLWPLLVVKFEGVPTTAQVAEYLEELTRYLERGERYITLNDTTGMTGMGPSEQRQMQVDWMKRHAERCRELSLGVAYAAPSPLVRLTVSVIFFLQPTRAPYLVTSTVSSAAAWVADQLEERGLGPVAERVREHYALSPPARRTDSSSGWR
jgi:hypothetical protein